jgi:hypothetical protein
MKGIVATFDCLLPTPRTGGARTPTATITPEIVGNIKNNEEIETPVTIEVVTSEGTKVAPNFLKLRPFTPRYPIVSMDGQQAQSLKTVNDQEITDLPCWTKKDGVSTHSK